MSSTLTNLTAATTWSGTDLFYALVGGNSRKIAASSFWTCDAANVLSDVNSTNAQSVRIYKTFTDSSNYERLAFKTSGGLEIAAETAGTGTDNLNITLTPAGTGRIIVVSGTGLNPPIDVTNSVANDFASAGNFWCSAITANQKALFVIGKDTNTANAAVLGFTYVGTDNAANSFSIQFYGSNTGLSIAKAGSVAVCESITLPAAGSVNARLVFTTSQLGIYVGSGAPTVSAAKGSLYLRSDGSSTSTRLYVNTDGGTTWTNVTTAA